MIYTISNKDIFLKEIHNDLSMFKELKYVDEASNIDTFIKQKLTKAFEILQSIIRTIKRAFESLMRKINSMNLRQRIKRSKTLNVTNNTSTSTVSQFVKKEQQPFDFYTWDSESIFDAIENMLGMEQSSQAYDSMKYDIDHVWFNPNNPKSFVSINTYSEYDINSLTKLEMSNAENAHDFFEPYNECDKFINKQKMNALKNNNDDISDMSVDILELMGYALTKAYDNISNFYSNNSSVLFDVTG